MVVPTPQDPRHPVRWQRTYVNMLLLIDTVGISVSMAVAYVVRFGASSGQPVGDRPALFMATGSPVDDMV